MPALSWNRHRAALLLVAAGLCASGSARASGAAGVSGSLSRPRRSRVPFVENRGQLPSDIAYSAPTSFGAVSVARDAHIVYDLSPGTREGRRVLSETLISGHPRPTPGVPAPTRVAVFVGSDSRRWRSDLSTFEEIELGEAWPGISVSLRARGGSVEKVFTVQPLARVDRIRIRLAGARRIDVGNDGALVVGTDGGAVRFTPPTAWQDIGGSRHGVDVAYVVAGSTYGFRLGLHKAAAPVVIDPIFQSSYIGGADPDSANAMAVDPSNGDVIVAGHSYSNIGRGVDGFVARFDSTLRTLKQLAYLGGSGGEEIVSVAIHPATGDVYVAGSTDSADFPGVVHGAQSENAGNGDGFIARLDSTLTSLLGATFCGGKGDEKAPGSGVDKIYALAIHPSSGDVYVGGSTTSTDLPGTAGGAQASLGGIWYAGFAARFDPALATLRQATYFGSAIPGCDVHIHALSIHPSTGEILVGGQACGVPAFEGGAQSEHDGFNGFVARIDPALTRFLQSTYVSSWGVDDVRGIVADPRNGDVLATGWTDSPGFTATADAFQTNHGGQTDAFIARYDSSLTKLVAATYLGSGYDDYGQSMALDSSNGDVLVAGGTFSTDLPGAAAGAQPAAGGGGDAFVARFDPALTRLVQATYLGGADDDAALAVAVHPMTGDVLVAGTTASSDFPGVAGGAQSTYGGGSEILGGDGFATRLAPGLAGPNSPCTPNADSLCLTDNRFRVRVDWHVPSQGRIGTGTAVPLSGDTGYFWFFSDANVELVVKVLDARSVNGHFWVFYGALSSVEYTIIVTDTATGVVKTYTNPSGSLASVADTSAFAASAQGAAAAEASEEQVDRRSVSELYAMYAALTSREAAAAEPINPCAAGGPRLCLDGNRFQAEVDWEVPNQGRSGHGTAVPLTGDTGCFWFFSSANVELVVKVLDGRGVNGHVWVFYGALSSVQYRITVTDTETGAVKMYDNASGSLASVADTLAF